MGSDEGGDVGADVGGGKVGADVGRRLHVLEQTGETSGTGQLVQKVFFPANE